MGEDFDPLTTEAQVRPIGNRQILWLMAASGLLLSIVTAIAISTNFGIGVAFGCLLAFGNFYWLDRSTKAIFASEASASTLIAAAKYLMRFIALGFMIYLVYLTGAFPVAAVVLGLATFAFAVVFQGIRNIFTSSI